MPSVDQFLPTTTQNLGRSNQLNANAVLLATLTSLALAPIGSTRETKGTDWEQIKVAKRHGTQRFGQSSDGTGTPDHVAIYNADGSLTDSAVAISPGGGGGGGGTPTPLGTWVRDEVPVPAPDNVTAVFAIANIPLAGTLSVFLNGDRQDNTRWVQATGNQITFTVAPLDIDFIKVNYEY